MQRRPSLPDICVKQAHVVDLQSKHMVHIGVQPFLDAAGNPVWLLATFPDKHKSDVGPIVGVIASPLQDTSDILSCVT